ncbi:MAG TPA: STAS domain-containing protein [Candidatus Limiplasma sp.]|nr:STAS domain-containing protein [Candidatus Limiplasma sp.]HPS82662.1 STAS domain-containing protein [Candidatus Limiplasma sp.]
MTIATETSGKTLTVKLDGRLDTITSPDLEQALSDLTGVAHLVLDFTKITYISSAGLRVLLALQKRMGKQGDMIVRHVDKMVMEVLEMSGFVDILTIE